jgi:hypothetical protein
MEDFVRLFGSLRALVYHCFDRIVILSHLPLLTRPENIVHFFRDVHGVGAITNIPSLPCRSRLLRPARANVHRQCRALLSMTKVAKLSPDLG